MNGNNHNKLYRDDEHGIIAGVCAGIADYFGTNRTLVRVIAVLSLMMFTVPTAFAYLAATYFLSKKLAEQYGSDDEQQFWRSMHRSPRDTLGSMRTRFRELDRRIRTMETYLTSRKFTLDREFDKIRD